MDSAEGPKYRELACILLLQSARSVQQRVAYARCDKQVGANL